MVVARAMLGDKISAGGAWTAVAPRLLSLIGLILLQVLIFAIPAGILIGLAILFAVVGGGAAAIAIGILAFIALVVASIALLPTFALATPVLVLERRGPVDALKRAFELQREGYWRLLGILVLTYLITGIVSSVISVPFSVGTVATMGTSDGDTVAGMSIGGLALAALGTAIGQILTMPFTASVQTLLYADQRMRREPFVGVLQSEASRRAQTGVPLPAPDDIWLPQPAYAAPTSWGSGYYSGY